MKTRVTLILALLLLVVLSAACASPRSTISPVSEATPINVAALADSVVAQVQAQLPKQTAEIDSATLSAAIKAELEKVVPAVAAEKLQQMVDEAVQARLAQQGSVSTVSQTNLVGDAADLQTTLESLYQRTNPSVVYIITSQGSGSGFVYDNDGHIVTNRHVVAGSNQFEVVFASGERQAAELVGADADSDMAVLKVGALPNGVQPLPLAQADAISVGQFVVAIGNPFGEQGSMTLGVVSGLGRSLRSQRGLTNSGTAYSLPSVIQTDAPINPGNSGGPLLNLAGEVVGINSAIASATGVGSGVGFAIPVVAVHQIVPDLISQGGHNYSYLGVSFDDEISLRDQSLYGIDQTQGAYVVSISPGGPADQAGLRQADPNTGRGGDLVVAIDGQPVGDFGDLNSYLVFHTQPGQQIELSVLRNGEQISVPVTLGERP
ncbi:MAG: trypsin-like peptidase domain-containing protein [Anaerolineae bacterium]